MPEAIVDDRRVVFHPLGMREDAGEWIVGRADTGHFVALPPDGVRAIRLLRSGLSVAETQWRIHHDTGRRLAVASFVDSLAALGFVRSLDGREVDSPAPIRPSLPRIRAEHVRWLLSPVVAVLLLAVPLAAAAVLVVDPGLRPSWHQLIWSDRGTLFLAGQAALAWVLIYLHELSHLLTARAAGVPGTIRLGTRLQFLVMQTDVSGIWQCTRRVRWTVYLSGIVLDLAISGSCVLTQAAIGPNRFLSSVMITKLLGVAIELMVFMRTDVYFLLQDMLSCRSLYQDAAAYCRYLAARCAGREHASPVAGLQPRERRIVRGYAVLLVAGSVCSLVLAYLVYTKVTLVLATRAVHTLAQPSGPLSTADAVATLAALVSAQGLWMLAWWRRHGARVRALLGRGTARSARPSPRT
ncbi:putative peptide zinc metalloprotease protein [Kitasatospora sp. GP30]|uniref:hypothetical protein n=1 Tax=Kitasatospora sp. GP30 TaxID=3035084 RepID=UPI000CC3C839|nr:hypothetical protein [Kitasatospora sp. GP30]MDH6143602.1 putative peptide zinc metalloprotease protein [Kitasatospora sp. GP30]